VIIEATATDFAALLAGKAPRNLFLVNDSELAPPEILAMLAGLAATIRTDFEPAAWMLVEASEIVGLCSLVRAPEQGELNIGYGVAPTRQGRGIAGRAIGEILHWARHDPRVDLVTAETAIGNLASQRVLERNGFVRCGERHDAEDGQLICWQVRTS